MQRCTAKHMPLGYLAPVQLIYIKTVPFLKALKQYLWHLIASVLVIGALSSAQAQQLPDSPTSISPNDALLRHAEQSRALPLHSGPSQPIQLAQLNIFQQLFGSQNSSQPQDTQQQPQSPGQEDVNVQQRPEPEPLRAQVTKPNFTPKAQDAVRILVVGDSMALDLSRALDRLYKNDLNTQIMARVVGSSGLVRSDFFNWPQFISKQLVRENADLAVVLIGINDRQDLRTRDPETKKALRFKTLGEDWQKLYRQRIAQVHGAFAAHTIPVIWVGLPPMQAKNYSSAIAQITALHQIVTQSQNARFVDIWDGFLTAEGAYTRFGVNLEGQRVQMRKANGVHFTTKGADKVALFVDRQIKQIYKGGILSVAKIVDPLEGTDAQFMLRLPFQSLGGRVRIEFAGPRISLNAAPTDNGGLRQVDLTALTSNAPDIVLSDLAEAPQGRADDFIWVHPDDPAKEKFNQTQSVLDIAQDNPARLSQAGS